MSAQVSVVITHIPVRGPQLLRAMISVTRQTLSPAAVHIACDVTREGAALTRDRGLDAVSTEWVAFLDDDDEFYPRHLEALLFEADRTGADLVYPWFDVIGGTDPFPQFEGQPWDDTCPHQVPVTFLARAETIRKAGAFGETSDLERTPAVDELGNRAGEDYRLILRLIEGGAHIVHLPLRTWAWHHWATDDGRVGNTSGLPSRW